MSEETNKEAADLTTLPAHGCRAVLENIVQGFNKLAFT